MDLRILFSMLTLMFSGCLDGVSGAPVSEDSPETPFSPERHARTKRCSCATFLDKECVYFCHLDIIWVNTPERVVSYGLGNAARRKRAIRDPVVPRTASRCACVSAEDRTCTRFCQPGNHLRYAPARDKVILSAAGDACAEQEHKHAASKTRISRVKDQTQTLTSPPALTATLNALLLLKTGARDGNHSNHKGKDRDNKMIA